MESTTTTKNLNNMPIGFFDSGVGGLTVLKQLRELMPNEDIIYFGDTKNMPYGEKTKEQLIEYADKIFKFFENQGVKSVVMACNTTSATTYEIMRDKYTNFKIYPIIQSVTKILSELEVRNLGILATPATINSKAYSNGIKSYNSKINVIEIACPDWVKIVENNTQNSEDSIEKIKKKLDEVMEFSPDKIVLACTHYPYLLPQLTKFAKEDLFINPATYFAKFIKDDLIKNNLTSSKSDIGFEKFYVSSNPENFQKSAKTFYEVKSIPELINLDKIDNRI